ncbi:hypothetical protein MRB53_009255 [Persea americana]|uniref:Uncharacterized protein n=1 Tax=Persea americana TaxID=3435 RepID=A0ACC2LNK9_PERAE|nr:hypothetical protein MRB53_009255 [Persea americana]
MLRRAIIGSLTSAGSQSDIYCNYSNSFFPQERDEQTEGKRESPMLDCGMPAEKSVHCCYSSSTDTVIPDKYLLSL